MEENPVLSLRELCGAHDPEIASHLQPDSLLARFGKTKVNNAVHCTDLPEDGPLEVDYFFSSARPRRLRASPSSRDRPRPPAAAPPEPTLADPARRVPVAVL